jgi:hypothetical protein
MHKPQYDIIFPSGTTHKLGWAELGPSPETAAGMKTGQQVPGFSPLDDRAEAAPEKLIFQLPSSYAANLLDHPIISTLHTKGAMVLIAATALVSHSMPRICVTVVSSMEQGEGKGSEKKPHCRNHGQSGFNTRTFSSRARGSGFFSRSQPQ